MGLKDFAVQIGIAASSHVDCLEYCHLSCFLLLNTARSENMGVWAEGKKKREYQISAKGLYLAAL